MVLVKLGMGHSVAVNNRLVVPKHIGLLLNRYTQLSQSHLQANGLVHTNLSSNKLRTIGSSLNSCLILGVTVNRCLVDQMEDPCDRSSSDHVMVQVGINIVSEGDMFTKWSWYICMEELINATINSVCPVKALIRQC